MAKDKTGKPEPDDVAEFSGAMDDLVRKYDEVINEFKGLLDEQTNKILGDPKLEKDKQ